MAKKIKHYDTFCKAIDKHFAAIQKTINDVIPYPDDELEVKSVKLKEELIIECMRLNDLIVEKLG